MSRQITSVLGNRRREWACELWGPRWNHRRSPLPESRQRSPPAMCKNVPSEFRFKPRISEIASSLFRWKQIVSNTITWSRKLPNAMLKLFRALPENEPILIWGWFAGEIGNWTSCKITTPFLMVKQRVWILFTPHQLAATIINRFKPLSAERTCCTLTMVASHHIRRTHQVWRSWLHSTWGVEAVF